MRVAQLSTRIVPQPGLQAHDQALAALRSLSFPHMTTDERGRDDDVPHLELIDRTIATLQEARKALDLQRPNFIAGGALIEKASRTFSQLEELLP